MTWNIEYTDNFGEWWLELDHDQQDSITITVTLLEQKGPFLAYPHSSSIKGSKHPHAGIANSTSMRSLPHTVRL